MQNATSPHMPSGPSSSSTCQPGSSQQQLQQSPAKKETEEFDDEDLDALLESDPLPSGYREARLAQLTEELNSAQAHAHAHELSHTPQGEILDRKGSLTEMKDEKSLIELSSREPFCVIHFFHPDFQRCRIMDRHLDILAKRHKHTLFLKAAVENAPFLVDRLGVKVLPCVISFVDGNARDRIVGFEDLGGVDDFPTASLEFRLRNAGGSLGLYFFFASSYLPCFILCVPSSHLSITKDSFIPRHHT